MNGWQNINREDVNAAVGQLSGVVSFISLYAFSDPVISLATTMIFTASLNCVQNPTMQYALTGCAIGSFVSFFPNIISSAIQYNDYLNQINDYTMS